jgi:serine/threonine-protein kinase
MTPLEHYVIEWLRRFGRVPHDALTQLPPEVGELVKNRAELERIAEQLVAKHPKLALRRRFVIKLEDRLRANGGRLSPEERREIIRKARDFDWNIDKVDHLVEEALLRIGSTPEPSPEPHEPSKTLPEEPLPPPAPEARHHAGSVGARSASPARLAIVGLLAIVVLGGGYWFFGSQGADPATGGGAASTDHVRIAQRLLTRLGQPVEETGRFDAATRAAFDRALPQYAGMDELEPWLVEQLQAALDEADDSAWQTALSRGTAADVAIYLQRFPEGRHAGEAQERLTSLSASEQRADIVREIQQELNRLGRDVAETGELDQATLQAMDGFSGQLPDRTRARLTSALEVLRELDRWPPRDGETFQDCPVCPEMVAVPAGRFVMGSPQGERMRSPNESPQHEVSVPRFAMSRTEVTHGQWLACVNDGVCPSLPIPEEGDLRVLPVTHVSLTEALFYFRWLRERTGFDYRLPSEAEWEYAARAGTTTRFFTGECITSDQANFDARLASGDCPMGIYRGSAMPVASFPPNAFGLYDMNGNVLELTRDCWNSDYEGAPTDGSAWEAGDCSRAPVRGGSWSSSERELRSAARIRPGGATGRSEETGLRVAITLPGSDPR